MKYILAHTHGAEGLDFSTMAPEQLNALNEVMRRQDSHIAPSIFLRREGIEHLEKVIEYFWHNRAHLDRILGFSIEGPMLGQEGGVPSNTIWSPNKSEWGSIAELGKYGLRYVVASPDRMSLDESKFGFTIRDLIDLLYANGIRLAFGHFRRDDPALSARRSEEVLNYILSCHSHIKGAVLADHLFNDMPRKFKHAWRSAEEMKLRDKQIGPILAADWENSDIDELLGPVPAFLLREARAGRILPFLNFDGCHVDLEICKKTVDFVGVENVIGITDDTTVASLAGNPLRLDETSKLWMNDDGVVAAGSTGVPEQLSNLAALGFSSTEMHAIFAENAWKAVSPLGTQR